MSRVTFRCWLVEKSGSGVSSGMAARLIDDLPAGDVLVKVECSSANYKDALAATAHPGVVRSFPHVPGIDAAGRVAEGASGFASGDEVIITGFDLGAGQWGGWSQYVRVPAEWVVRLPRGLSLEEAMIYGTAGFTAAQSVKAIMESGIEPDDGEVVVTGASGGVGSVAVQLLSKLGYQVVAVTGKSEVIDRLTEWGAARVITREEVPDAEERGRQDGGRQPDGHSTSRS